MLCEECHQNEAVYTISVMMGEAMTQRHLCADCMAKMNMNIASGNMQKLLGAILNAINRGEQPEEGEKVPDDQPDITCPRCRMTLSKFIKTGRLGCPDCYQAFAAQQHRVQLRRERLIAVGAAAPDAAANSWARSARGAQAAAVRD